MSAQAIDFIITIVSLTVLGATFATVLYLLLKNRLDKTNTLTVKQDGVAEPLPGVPFYIKRGRVTHETSFLETLATLTLTGNEVELDDQGKAVKMGTDFVGVKTVSLSPAIEEAITLLQAKINEVRKAQFCSKQARLWADAKMTFADLAAYSGALPAHALPLERNVLVDSNYVDYETRLFLNKLQPFSGSSDLDITLAADGTLTKAIGKTVESTFEKLLGFIPKADSLIDKGPAAAAEEGEETSTIKEATPKTPVTVTLKEKCRLEVSMTMEQGYVRHIWFKEVTDRSYTGPAAWEQADYWYRREIITELEPRIGSPSPG